MARVHWKIIRRTGIVDEEGKELCIELERRGSELYISEIECPPEMYAPPPGGKRVGWEREYFERKIKPLSKPEYERRLKELRNLINEFRQLLSIGTPSAIRKAIEIINSIEPVLPKKL